MQGEEVDVRHSSDTEQKQEERMEDIIRLLFSYPLRRQVLHCSSYLLLCENSCRFSLMGERFTRVVGHHKR